MFQKLRAIIRLIGAIGIISLLSDGPKAQSLLINEEVGTRLVLGRYSTQKEVESLQLRSDIFSIDLKEISINATPLFREEKPTIREVYASQIPFLDQIIEDISTTTPNLEVLVLADSSIRSNSLSFLSKLRSLRVLDLSGTYLTDKKHLDELLKSNPQLTIYIESVLDYPFPSISLDDYNSNPRIVRKKFSISPYPDNAGVTCQYTK